MDVKLADSELGNDGFPHWDLGIQTNYVGESPATNLAESQSFNAIPDITYPDLPAVPDPGTAGYTAVGGTWSGGTFTKTAASGWTTARVYSNTSAGIGARSSFTVGAGSATGDALGLNSDPSTGINYTNIDHTWIISSTFCRIYKSGNPGKFFSRSASDIAEVFYDGLWVRYMLNGTEQDADYVGPGKQYYLDSSFFTVGDVATNITFQVVGTTYLQDAWATTDGWAKGGANPGTVTAPGDGTLVVDGPIFAVANKPINPSGCFIIIRAKKLRGAPSGLAFDLTGPYQFISVGTLTTDWKTYAVRVSGSTALGNVYVSTTVDVSFAIDWIYIGDGSYTWTVADDSGNGNVLLPKSGLSRVAGKTGYALGFDGSTGYATGNMANFGEKITVAFWENFTGSSTDKILAESGSGGGTDSGAFMLRFNSGGVVGRLQARINTASGLFLSGRVSLTLTGWHHIVMVYDRTVTSNNALILYVDGVQVSMTYDLTDSNRPTVYNGAFYIHSRAGTSLFADGAMDDLWLWRRALTAQEIFFIYQNPGFFGPFEAIAPIIYDGEEIGQQAAALAFTNTGSIEQLPEVGPPWIDCLVRNTPFSTVDATMIAQLSANGYGNYRPKYDIKNDQLLVSIVKVENL